MDKELISISFIIPSARDSLHGIINYLNKIYYKPDVTSETIVINDCPNRNLHITSFPFQYQNFNIKIINNVKNRGPGFSRNIGISIASKNYLCFLDDDDDLSQSTLIELSSLESHVDIICLSFTDTKNTFSNKKFFDSLENNNFNGETYSDALNKLNILASHCQPYLFNRKFLIKNNIKYLSTYIVEDITFVTLSILYAKHINIHKNDFYIYNSRPGTLKEDNNYYRIIDIFIAIKKLSACHLYFSNNSKLILLNNTIKFLQLLLFSRFVYSSFLPLANINTLKNFNYKTLFDSTSSSPPEHELFDYIKNTSLLDIANINHTNAVSIQAEIKSQIESIKNYFLNTSSLRLKSTELVFLYCYGPISIGYYAMFKLLNPTSTIFILDDNVIQNTKAPLREIVYSINDIIPIINSHSSSSHSNIIICHLHKNIIFKIRDKIIQFFETNKITDSSFEIHDPYSLFDDF